MKKQYLNEIENEIESLLESVFEKVGRQKVKCTVHSPNKQKFSQIVGDALTNTHYVKS